MDEPLPIYAALPELRARLSACGLVITQAPPGAGKSTVLPLELLNEPWLNGQRILMLEPRRLAARSVAARMAHTLGEPVGQTIGYHIRFERRTGPRTRIEVVTEGILTRRMQADPGLEGVGLVIFDEFHERSLDADLALALCRDAQRHLREDLRILILSATLDAEALRATLDDAPVITASGRQFPITVNYIASDPEGPLSIAVAGAVARALDERTGDVLAFLPGMGDILRAQILVAERHPDVAVLPLHGDLSLDAQQAALDPDPRGRRKVVLATSIAETSLTIAGIGVVVDSGFARVPRFDSRTGLTRLETARITRDSADQRSGRAGRLGPGACLRLWSAGTQVRLIPTRRPEILEADLAPLRLELAQWGARAAGELRWVTPPPAGALRQALDLLQQLGAMQGDTLTARGRAMLEWPTHPRLAHLLIASQAIGGPLPALAADVAALLDERDPLPRGSAAGVDLSLRVEALRAWRATGQSQHGADARALSRIERIAGLWRRQLNARIDNGPVDPQDVARLVALAYPDRIARARERGSARYRMANGRGVRLPDGDGLHGSDWLAVAHLDDGSDEGRIHFAAPLRETDLEALAIEHDVVGWDARKGALLAQRERRVGELVLSQRPLANPPREERNSTLCDALRTEGLGLLTWTEETRQWQARMESVRAWRGEPWPDVSDAGLLARVDDWLGPWLEGVSSRADFARLDTQAMLAALATRRQRIDLDDLAPAHLVVPSGSSIRLEYFPDGAAPVLAVKLQEMFGQADTPTVNAGRTKVLLHLLSPAQRPIQVTQDLRSFWTTTYPSVRKELRGRYNKHPWPEDPWTALPTKKTVQRMGGA